MTEDTSSEQKKSGTRSSSPSGDSNGLSAHVEHVSDGDVEKQSIVAEAGEADGSSPSDIEVHFISGLPLILLVTGLVLAVFVISMDFTILATAIPRITSEFRSIQDVGWYGSVYLLTTTAFQPSFGKLYTMFNVKWVYLTAMGIFEAGSIISALARNSPMLIVGRAISGVGASAIFSGGATIIGFSVPLHKRAVYIGILSSMFGIASVIGPLLGGVFTDRVTWRWCFWVNLPVGGAAMAVVLFFFKPPKRKDITNSLTERLRSFDVLGTILLIGAVTCLFLALQWGGIEYSWRDSRVFGTLIGFGLIVLCFLGWEMNAGDKASVPLRLFRNRTVWSSSLLSGFLIMALYCHVYYLPFYFQAVKGVSAEDSGVRSIPYFLALSIASIGGGFVMSALGTYVEFAWSGTVLLTIGSGLLHTLQVESSAGRWIGYQVLAGFGVGLALQTPFIAVQTVLDPVDMPIGMAIAIFFNSLGGSLSISIVQNIFLQGLRQNIPKFAPDVDASGIIEAGATDVSRLVSPEQVGGLLYAYNLSITNAFVFAIAAAGIAFLSSLAVERKSTRKKSST